MQWDWPRAACLAMEWIWAGTGCACLAAAAAIALKPGWRKAVENPSPELSRSLGKASLLAFGALFPLACAAFKLAQFRRLELLGDSATTGNLLWALAHGEGFKTSVCGGVDHFSVHFCLTYALAAPLARIFGGMAPLAALQGLAMGTAPLAAFFLGRRVASSAPCGLALALLTASTCFFHDLVGAAVTHIVAQAYLALWCAVLWEAGRPRLACAAAVLLLVNSDASGIVLAGFGAYLMLRPGGDRRAGAWVWAVSTAAWLAQMAFMRRAQAGLPPLIDHWARFMPLGSSPEELLRVALTRPWDYLLALVWPLEKLQTPARLLGAFSLLPAASGAALAPAFLMWIPHQLASPGKISVFHQLAGNESAYIFGPLVWASAHGLRRLGERFPGKEGLALAFVLLVSGGGLLKSASFLLEPGAVPAYWREAVPRAAAFIPSGASLWCDEMVSPNFAFRSRIKVLLRSQSPSFTRGFFVPDRVLYSLEWARWADPAFRDRLLGDLRARGFVKVFQEGGIIVLAAPSPKA